jgi:tuberous sclerosis protein 1
MSKGDELNLLRGQVELLHTQLLFERHRREAHALRNRSLAKRIRNMQQQEDKNYALVSNLDFYLQMKPKPDT